MLVVHLFYYPMIVRWLIGPMVKANYPLAAGSLQGTRPSSSISPSLSPANDGDEGLVRCLEEIPLV